MSQSEQDLVIRALFELIGTTNKQYVEFGFNNNEMCAGTGANTCRLFQSGWRGLLLDGGHRNESINLRLEKISSYNIAHLFRKHGVPKAVDYVSIDIDSYDLWVLEALLASEYRPRVISVEYNSNIPWRYALSYPDAARFSVGPLPDRIHHSPTESKTGKDEPSNHNCFVGASARAFDEVARAFGYTIVAVVPPLDLFLVQNDTAARYGLPHTPSPPTRRPFRELERKRQRARLPVLSRHSVWNVEVREWLDHGQPLNSFGSMAMTPAQAANLVDYTVWRGHMLAAAAMDDAVAAARRSAAHQVTQMAHDEIRCFRHLRNFNASALAVGAAAPPAVGRNRHKSKRLVMQSSIGDGQSVSQRIGIATK